MNNVEQGALMSPNPSGMHEDPCCWLCVCLEVVKFVNPLLVMVQVQMNFNLFEKDMFSKKSENSIG